MKSLVRDRWITGVSLALLLVQMFLKGHLRGGVLLAFVLVLAATVGVLGLLGDSPLDLRGDEATGEDDLRPWWRREGFWVLAFGALLYLPLAGAFGLWDPWETHYSEVAREILARDDWITTWWAQEGWFMSKPILTFWMSAMGMGVGTLFGLKVGADCGPGAHEWFIRVPICLLTIAALYAVYRAVASAWSRRAGFLCAVVLATMPQWFFLAHQAMTDMPFVAPLTLSLSMFALAVTSPAEALATARKVTVLGRSFRVSLWHLAVGFVLMCTLPQIAYLLTRSLVVACPGDANAIQCGRTMAANQIFGIHVPFEMFYLGSAGNSGVNGEPNTVGSPAWERVGSAVPFMPSVLQGVVWTALLVWLLAGLRALRSRQGLYMLLFYVWAAISTMGKGPGGIAIPAAVVGLHLVSTGRWRELRQVRLGEGLLAFFLVGFPWYIAITGRLGNEYIERFLYHDIINRTAVGVHGDTGSVRYFIWQLGYATFPWCGLVPAALAGWRLIVPRDASEAQKDVARIALLWFLVSFVLFSAMITKFHHYIFPAVPAAAILVGLLLDRMLGAPRVVPASEASWEHLSLLLLGGALTLMVAGGASCVGSWRGTVPVSGVVVAHPVLGAGLLIAGAALWVVAWVLFRRAARASASGREGMHYREAAGAKVVDEVVPEAVDPDEASLSVAFGASAVGAAAVCAMVARDLVVVRSNPPGFERLIHLFVYNYDRAWPTRALDYRGALFGFGLVAVITSLALMSRALRPWAVRGVLMLGALFALWGLDVYMLGVTPHWSQRGLFERYYAMRHAHPGGPFAYDPIVAYQMNWKGENFYTGNHVFAMECGLKYCTERTNEWAAAHPNTRTFFVTEHSRVASLLSTLRAHGGDGHTVTTERDDNKFVLVEGNTGSGRAAPAAPARPAWQPGRTP